MGLGEVLHELLAQRRHIKRTVGEFFAVGQGPHRMLDVARRDVYPAVTKGGWRSNQLEPDGRTHDVCQVVRNNEPRRVIADIRKP